MAKNPRWNKPLSSWEEYFAEWIMNPESQNLLDAIIFFDFRNVYGNQKFTDRLREMINSLISQQTVFLYHLAGNTFNTKIPNIVSGNALAAEMLDLKASVNHIIMFARIYSLQYNLWSTNTIERLYELKSKQIIEDDTADEIIFVYNHLMKLRFKNQIRQLDNNLPLSNQLNIKSLIEIEVSILKKVISLIPGYHNKLNFDFRLTT
jgi:CBS domain-containing protein